MRFPAFSGNHLTSWPPYDGVAGQKNLKHFFGLTANFFVVVFIPQKAYKGPYIASLSYKDC